MQSKSLARKVQVLRYISGKHDCCPKSRDILRGIMADPQRPKTPPSKPEPSEKAKPGAKADPKPKGGTLPYYFPERSAGVGRQGRFDEPPERPPRNDGSHSEFIWGATGVVITILAVVYWGFLFVIAGVLYAIGVYKAPWFSRQTKKTRFQLKAAIDVAIAIMLLSIWWLVPTPEFAKSAKDSTPSVNIASPSPTTTTSPPVVLNASPSPSPQTTPVASPSIVSRAGEPTPSLSPSADLPLSVLKGIPFKGGSSQRLDALMTAAGYSGMTAMAVLYVRSNDANENEIIVGTRPDLNAKNSWVLESAGEWFEFRGGENTARVYILSDKDGKVDITYRPK